MHSWGWKLVNHINLPPILITISSNVHSIRGTTLARIVGLNTPSLSEFDDRVILWVYDEMIDGVPLSRVINKTHENPKYLPGFTLSDNVVCWNKNTYNVNRISLILMYR